MDLRGLDSPAARHKAALLIGPDASGFCGMFSVKPRDIRFARNARCLEHAAGLPASRTIAHSDDAEPVPGDVADLREAVLAGQVGCLFKDAETNPASTDTLGEGARRRTAQVDRNGAFLEPGSDLYPTLMEALAAALETCLASTAEE